MTQDHDTTEFLFYLVVVWVSVEVHLSTVTSLLEK